MTAFDSLPSEITIEVTQEDIDNAVAVKREYNQIRNLPTLDSRLDARTDFAQKYGLYSSWCVVGQAARRVFGTQRIVVDATSVDLVDDDYVILAYYVPTNEQSEYALGHLVDRFDVDRFDELKPATIHLCKTDIDPTNDTGDD